MQKLLTIFFTLFFVTGSVYAVPVTTTPLTPQTTCPEGSYVTFSCGRIVNGQPGRACQNKYNFRVDGNAFYSCNSESIVSTGALCPKSIMVCQDRSTKRVTNLFISDAVYPRPAAPPVRVDPKPYRFGLAYDQVRIPNNNNHNMFGKFVFPIINTDHGLFGLDLGLGHSLERNLYTRVGLVYDYTVVSWFEVGGGVDFTFIPGGSQDESNVYFWSAGARLRAALVIPKHVLAFRPSLGVSFGYSYGHWEAVKNERVPGAQCALLDTCETVQQTFVRQGGVFSINPTLDIQVSF